MPIYKKLVRDRIPEIIEKSGKKYKTEILSNKDYIRELKNKTKEELGEYFDAKSDEEALEELADVLELIHALANVHGASIEEVEEVRRQKSQKRGGFSEKIFLLEVHE